MTELVPTEPAKGADPNAVPDTFEVRAWGNAPVYACEVVLAGGARCPFDTVQLGVAQVHARYGHFEAVEPGEEHTSPVATHEAPKIEVEAAHPDTVRAAAGTSRRDAPVADTAPTPTATD